ncbi:MAG: hypothetical protein Q9227_000918 [Pyrenula ochraceoflavens]
MPDTLQIDLVNNTSSSTVYAHITGLAIDHNNSWFLLQSDGKTPFYAENPPSIGSPVPTNYAIPLGEPGSTKSVTIPHLAGGRIYFSIDKPLTFLLNPGPALVEPSVTNPSDPNYSTLWSFMEFTFNPAQLYANISYVDFVSLPISLTLHASTGPPKSVLGLPSNALPQIASALHAQSTRDNASWSSLIVPRNPSSSTPSQSSSEILRILSPNQAMVLHPTLFSTYFDPYTTQLWQKYSTTPLHIDTQSPSGTVTALISPSSNSLTITSPNSSSSSTLPFPRPTTHDIFSAASGPFTTSPTSPLLNAIIPRINAEMNRSTLHQTDRIPAPVELHYQSKICNHYARVVHEVSVDGRGYAHPYDDVAVSGGGDRSGFVNAGSGEVGRLVVRIGGGGEEG